MSTQTKDMLIGLVLGVLLGGFLVLVMAQFWVM